LTPRSSALLPVHITTARRPDHIRLSSLLRSRSTQFIVHASSQLGHAGPWPPETRSFFCHFGGVLTYAGEVGSDRVTTTRAWANATIDILSAAFINYGWVSIALLSIFMALQPAAAYSVAGIGHCTHSPAISSAMHLGACAKLDPAVWAPVESSFQRSPQLCTWGRAQNWIQQCGLQ